MVPSGLTITLVEPQYPINLGYMARVAKNFGVSKLYLVNPKADISVALIYASHADDVLYNAERIDFDELRKRHELLIATTAIRARSKRNVIREYVKPEDIANYIRSVHSSSLVFGRDTTGLTNDEIKLCDIVTSIDTGTVYRSLNISHAAAILLYLISRSKARRYKIPSRVARRVFAQNLCQLATAAGLSEHKIRNLSIMANRMAANPRMSERDMLLMTGIFRRAVLMFKRLRSYESRAY